VEAHQWRFKLETLAYVRAQSIAKQTAFHSRRTQLWGPLK